MRPVIVCALLALLAVPTLAQSDPPAQSQDRLFSVRLLKTLDAKNAKIGDTVQAELLDDLQYGKSEDRKTFPRHSRLIGHVVEAQPFVKGTSPSRLGLAFDKAVAKDGTETNLTVLIIQFVAPVKTAITRIQTMSNGDNPMARAAGPVYDNGRSAPPSDPVIDAVGSNTGGGRVTSNVPPSGWHSVGGNLQGNKTAVLISHKDNARLERDTLIYLRLVVPDKV